jgi:hypothetical protein
MTKRFKLGDRVIVTGWTFGGRRIGEKGTVSLVAGPHGMSIYCDPSRLLVFVRWDNGDACGEYSKCLSHEEVKS